VDSLVDRTAAVVRTVAAARTAAEAGTAGCSREWEQCTWEEEVGTT